MSRFKSGLSYILSAIIFFGFPYPFGESVVFADEKVELTYVLNAEELSRLLLQRISPIDDSVNFLWTAQRGSESSVYNKVVESDDALLTFSQSGSAFRDFYFNRLKEGFSGLSFDWATEPDGAIQRALIREQMRLELQDSPMPQSIASRQAWRETLVRLNLPDDLSYNEVAERSTSNKSFERVLGLYQRLYLVYLDETVKELDHPPFEFDEFFARMELKAVEARKSNFRQALGLLSTLRREPFLFLDRLSGNTTRLTVEQLARAEIKFAKNASSKGTQRLKVEKWYDWITGVADGVASHLETFDVSDAKAYYKTHLYTPSSPSYLVAIEVDGETIRLSERNYAEFLHQLLATTKTGKTTDNIWKSRYILEASRRDVMVADSLNFLKSLKPKGSVGSLVKSFSQRVRGLRAFSDYRVSSLTQRIRSFGDSPEDSSRIAGIRWAGYQVHPDYWVVRDSVSRKSGGIGLAKYVSSQGEAAKEVNLEELEATKSFLKGKKREKKYSKYRVGSKARRSRMVAWVWATILVGFAATTTGYLYLLAQIVELIDGAQSTQSMDRGASHGNNSFESQQGNGQIIFDIDVIRDGASMPGYYNDLGRHNLPESMRYGNNRLGEEPALVSEIAPSSDMSLGDVSIETHVPFEAVEGRVPILTPDYYTLESITVTLEGEKLKPIKDYRVYQVPQNGLYYFELSKDGYGDEFHYEATFSEGAVPKLNSRILNIKSADIRPSIEKLEKAGATELARNLGGAIGGQATVSLGSLEQVVYSSGFYTYDSESWNFGDGDSPFYESTQYLRDGVHYYQCTGSNHLLGNLVEEIYSQAGLEERVGVEQVSGFVLNNGKGHITYPGHRRTLVTDLKVENSFRIIDGTPHKMDPKYASKEGYHPLYWTKKGGDKNEKPRKREHEAGKVIGRRERIALSKPVGATLGVEGQDELAQGLDSKSLLEKVNELKVLKEQLKGMVKTVIKGKNQSVTSNSIHKSMQDLFFFVDLLDKFAKKRISVEGFSQRLVSNSLGIHFYESDHHILRQVEDFKSSYALIHNSDAAIVVSFLKDMTKRYTSVLERASSSAKSSPANGHSYLIDEQVRWASYQLLEGLSSRWIEYTILENQAGDCSRLLSAEAQPAR